MARHWTRNFEAAFVAGYLECAEWASTDDEGEPLDRLALEFHPDALHVAGRDCLDFIAANQADIDAAYLGHDRRADYLGHDFWLTREGHGTGFWDRDLGDVGDRLTEASKQLGPGELYVGDDRMLHFG